MAEQEGNQEHVDFYQHPEPGRPLVAKVPDVPVTYLAARPVELPANWPVEKMRAFIQAKQVQFTNAVPDGRLVSAVLARHRPGQAGARHPGGSAGPRDGIAMISGGFGQ